MKKQSGSTALRIILLVAVLLLTGVCILQAQTPPAAGTDSVPLQAGPTLSQAVTEEPLPTATDLFEEIVTTRTPAPTVTPGRIVKEVAELTASLGLDQERFLGLTTDEWISLGTSILISLLAYLIGTWLLKRLLPRLVQGSVSDFDDRFLEIIGSDLRWLLVLVILYFTTRRLIFVSAQVKAALTDLYFVLGLFVSARILWELVGVAEQWTRARLAKDEREEGLSPIIVLMVRLTRLMIVIVGAGILLSHFGINVAALVAALGLGGLAISLAAQDTIADMIAGFIVLVDRPFRIHDRIEIQDVGTWGDVVEIGLRTTRIRTRDNRMVIVPNGIIGSNQVINYTYPDPQYRIETHVRVAYGTDIKTARRVIVDAVRHVEGVLTDRPVDALYIEMGDSAMIFRVRWWIESYVDTRRMFDRVHTGLQKALDEAGIKLPFPTQSLNIRSQPGMLGRPAEPWHRNTEKPALPQKQREERV
jgi:MscS family membrane protein